MPQTCGSVWVNTLRSSAKDNPCSTLQFKSEKNSPASIYVCIHTHSKACTHSQMDEWHASRQSRDDYSRWETTRTTFPFPPSITSFLSYSSLFLLNSPPSMLSCNNLHNPPHTVFTMGIFFCFYCFPCFPTLSPSFLLFFLPSPLHFSFPILQPF